MYIYIYIYIYTFVYLDHRSTIKRFCFTPYPFSMFTIFRGGILNGQSDHDKKPIPVLRSWDVNPATMALFHYMVSIVMEVPQ